jgi:protein SCO1/2/putative membrane protein
VIRSYGLGLAIVASTILAAASFFAIAGVRTQPNPAAQDLSSSPLPLGPFRLEERSGRRVTDADLSDRVWVAAFIFTRCPSSCPRISGVMKSLQDKLASTNARLVSISVDPTHDTPKVLSDYARRFGADPNRWWFLTGAKDDVYRVILDQFKVPVSESSQEDRQRGAEAVSHSARLAVVDRGNKVVGYFDSTSPDDIATLVSRARQLAVPRWTSALPSVNASLNATSAVLLLLGWRLVRIGRIRAHSRCMIAALTVSALFLACYLVYHFNVGSVRFRGVGPARYVYLTILLSHTVLAVAIVPMIAMTVLRAYRRQFIAHSRIARVTFPIWMYVSLTGVVVYLMLYHMDFAAYPG